MSRKLLFALLAGAVTLALAGLPAYAQVAPGTSHLSADTVSVPSLAIAPPIPPNCTTWHDLWPVYCVTHHQDAFKDNGDGRVSRCDGIVLDGVYSHVAWAGPGFHLSKVASPGIVMVAVPYGPPSDGDPTCQTWHEIYPNFCTDWHVDGWTDNGSGVLDACDIVSIGGEDWHIDAITRDIIVEEPVPTTSRVGTLVLILLLALIGLVMVVRARRRMVQAAS